MPGFGTWRHQRHVTRTRNYSICDSTKRRCESEKFEKEKNCNMEKFWNTVFRGFRKKKTEEEKNKIGRDFEFS